MREQVSRFSLYSPLDSLLLEQSDEKMTDGGGSRSQLCSKVKSWGIFVCSRGKIYEDHLRRPRPNTYATGAPPLSIMAHGGNRRVARHGRCIAPRIMSYTRGRERERGRKNTSMGETCVARPITGEEIKKGERERREGRKKERRGKKKGGETKKLARMYGAKDWYWWAVEWLQQARETAALKNGRDSLTLARSFHSRAASLECNEEAYVARRKRAGQKNEGKRRGGKSNKTSKTITGNGVQRWSGEARRIAWRSWESREEEANDR